MNRRGFIGALLRGAVGAPLMPVAALAASASGRRVRLQQSPVAGFQYYEGERIFRRLREGMALNLVREPENKYDERAVAVYVGGCKLGFVPRLDNAAVAQMLDRGERLSARIVRLQQSANPWDRVQFEVTLDG